MVSTQIEPAEAAYGMNAEGGDKDVSVSQKISLGEKLAYAGGDAACNVVFGLASTLLPFFYTDYMGISAGVIGSIILISRIFDGGSDVIMGFITDRTKSRYGKARPWILWMTVPYGLTFVALFLLPAGFSDWAKAVYIFIAYNLVTTVVYTALNLPYCTLGSLMTRDQHERGVTQALRMAISPLGRMTVTAATLPLVSYLGNDQRSWIIVTSAFAVIAMILLFICFYYTRERVVIEAAAKTRTPAKESLKALFKNKYWFLCLCLWGMMVVASTIVGTILPYYCKYILLDQNYVSYIYLAEQITMIVVILLLPLGLKRFGKRNMTLYGTFLVIAGQLVFLAAPTNITLAVVCSAIKGAGYAPLWGTIFAMIADAVEYGQWKTRVRQDGMIYSAASVGSKIGGGFASAIVGIVFSIAGYNGLAEIQSESAILVIRESFLWAPIVLAFVNIALLLFYKLDKEYPLIAKELAQREACGEC